MPDGVRISSYSSSIFFHLISGLSRFASSKLISRSDLHSPTLISFLIACKGTHHALRLSFSKNEVAGRIISASTAVGVLNRSTHTIKSIFFMALYHFFGSRPVFARGLAVCIHIALIGYG